jgi:alkylation response protein AidB-like acyl-CoA dehydrogenase
MNMAVVVERAEALRVQVQEFCRKELPPELADRAHRHQVMRKEDYAQWMKLLETKGWATGHWPKAWGGLDWTPLERFVFEDTLAREGCPWILPFGVKYVGPVIYAFGSDEQKKRFLGPIKTTDEFWAQGYSEPGAGSDLVNVSTYAELDESGENYVVNGQKVWTTYAHWADWLFCLVRTSRDDKPQRCISFLLIDMKSPGVTVKPIGTMDGYHHVNEVWLENVKVPVANLIGEPNKGWTYAKYLLVNERTTGAVVGWARHALDRLQQCVRQDVPESRRAALQEKVARFELRFLALEQGSYQAVRAMMDGTENGGEASYIKVRGPELYQEVMETLVEALGMAGVARDLETLHSAGMPPLGPDDAGGLIKDHLYNRAATIFGGSSEVQRNIVAKAVLGL